MSLLTIVLRNLAQRKLSSALTSASVALGVAVVIAVLTLKAQSLEGFTRSAEGYDLVVGPRGSALQLVLNTLYHMDELPGTLPWARYKEVAAHRAVRSAVPVAVGDQVGGFRIVATSDAYFADLGMEGRAFGYDAARVEHAMEGHGHGGPFEAVAGATAARALGLRVGGTFAASHGLRDAGETHAETWTVTGVLRPTGTPVDRAVYINLDSFYAIQDHRAVPRISAVLVRSRDARGRDLLASDLADHAELMAVKPSRVILELFEWIGQLDDLLFAVAVLVIVVGAVSILVALTNSMAERRRAIAILRALGARRSTVLSIVVMEAAGLCLLGGVAGIALGHGLTAIASQALAARSGVPISALTFQAVEISVLAYVVALGALAGIVPAVRAYRTDIADGLSPSS